MKIKDDVLIALLAGILVISKEILAFLPNVEIVSFLLIIYTCCLNFKRAILIALVFSLLEILLYGLGMWTIMYMVLWPLLCFLTHLLSPYLTTELRLAIFSGTFGLSFGLLYETPYFLVDFNLGLGVWLQGLPFDFIHGIGNYLIMLILYEPIYTSFESLVLRFEKI